LRDFFPQTVFTRRRQPTIKPRGECQKPRRRISAATRQFEIFVYFIFGNIYRHINPEIKSLFAGLVVCTLPDILQIIVLLTKLYSDERNEYLF